MLFRSVSQSRYVKESDVIRDAGEDALIKIAEGGENDVYVDLKHVQERAERENEYGPYTEFLLFVNNNGTYDGDKKVNLKGGAIIHNSTEPPEGAIHITRSAVTESRLKMKGLKVAVPKFLIYGTETLRQGFMEVVSDKDPSKVKIEDLLEADQSLAFHNQYLRVVSGNKEERTQREDEGQLLS